MLPGQRLGLSACGRTRAGMSEAYSQRSATVKRARGNIEGVGRDVEIRC